MIEPTASEQNPPTPCEHYWIRVCGLCDKFDSADFARELTAHPVHPEAVCEPSTPPNLDAIRATVAKLTEVCPDSPWDEDWLALAGQQLRAAVDELEQLRAEVTP